MRFDEFIDVVNQAPNCSIQIVLPDGEIVPAHFHITEVGKVQKDFIDCGGTIRSNSSCVLQVWIAEDLDHRLDTTKLAKILGMACRLINDDSLPMEIEFDTGTVSQFKIVSASTSKTGISIQLGAKHTACLALDLCIVNPQSNGNCSSSTCC